MSLLGTAPQLRFTLLLPYPALHCPDASLVPNQHQRATLCPSNSLHRLCSCIPPIPPPGLDTPSQQRHRSRARPPPLCGQNTPEERVTMNENPTAEGTERRVDPNCHFKQQPPIRSESPRGNSHVSSCLSQSFGTWQADMQHTSSLVLTDISPKVLVSQELAVLFLVLWKIEMIITCH